MSRKSAARQDIRHFKTLGLLGKIFKESVRLRKEGIPILPLHLGDPPQFDFTPPESLKEGIIKSIDKNIHYAYGNPQGYPPLLEKIAEIEQTDVRHVFTGNGLSDLMDKLFNCIAVPGTNILLPAPVFPPYMDINIKNNVESRLYVCDPHTWHPVVKSIDSHIDDNTSLLLINSPNNPSGAVYHEDVLKETIDLVHNINIERCKKNVPPLIMLFDEIYKELYIDKKPPSIKEMVKDKHITYIIFNGASKAFNATGLRVGYAVLGGVEKDELREVLYNECMLPLCINSIFQEGYLAALSDPKISEYLENNRKRLKSRRDLLLNAFAKIPGIDVVKPEGAFYMIIKMDTEFDNDLDLGLALLKEEKICTSQMSAFFNKTTQPEGTYLRLVFLPPEEILEDSTERIAGFMDRHRRGKK